MIRTATVLLLLIICTYGGVKAWPLISGPHIQYDIQTQGADPGSGPGFTTISGKAIHTETLTMDGATLLIDKEGNFICPLWIFMSQFPTAC